MASPDIDALASRLSGLGHGGIEEETEFQRLQHEYEMRFRKDKEKEPLDENDPKIWMKQALDQVKTLTTAVSVPLLQVVKIFEGDPCKFKQWEREIERYAQMAKLADEDIPRIAYITSSGSVELFIRRYLEEKENEFLDPTWSDLKQILQKRFADICDPQQAMAMLRKIRQKPDESVQIFSERFLRIADDAYPPTSCSNETAKKIIEKQLVDIFCDALYYDYLRIKVMREDPQDFESAVNVAMNEQNLRKRFQLRSEGNTTTDTATTNQKVPLYTNDPSWTAQNAHSFRNQWAAATDHRDIEPMDIGHMRRKFCYKCKKSGHKASECIETRPHVTNANTRRRTNNHQAAAVETDNNRQNRGPNGDNRNNYTPDWLKSVECWSCHMMGHFQRNCPRRRPNLRNNYRPGNRTFYRQEN